MFTPRDLEVINLELSINVQNMEEAIRNGKKYNQDTLSLLDDMRAAVSRARLMMRTPDQQRSQFRVVEGGLSAA